MITRKARGPEPSSSSIGPQIPAHLLNQNSSTSTTSSSERKLQVFDDDDDDDDGPQPSGHSIGPAFPPEFRRTAGPTTVSGSRPVAGPPSSSTSHAQGARRVGPTLPPGFPSPAYDEDSDDDDIGPKPLPASMQQQHQQSDAVREFLEREEKRRKAAEEAAKPKAPKREEWMLVPPTTAGLLGNLDPTKLKARQFSTSTSASTTSSTDNSLWTETPQERQQRLADEVSGKKRRVTDTSTTQEDEDEKVRKKRRKQEEEAIRRGVEQHTASSFNPFCSSNRQARGAALIEQHKSALASKKSDESDEVPGIWDHSRDMALGGRLMDDDKRNKMLREAKGLGDRFGSGKSGGFL
ncbi:hypothetical protein CPB84DRAFT_1744596 [Gymnopilus junonius]|uniref:DUF3752 domain-containing protein n=1 Tax=Gymnopilus junonius TaxID=109634 RepID=A0A9P5NV28_GYMJU|nr:hypothetical protein CPB84DRAFT_1744596 [Gymnopilus junonius]